MRSYSFRSLNFFFGNSVARLALFLAILIIPSSVFAQPTSWQVDSQQSVARLSVGSGANAAEVGVARVRGRVITDAQDPAVILEVAPGKSAGAEYSEVSFISKRGKLTSDGKLVVTGELAVTRVERPVEVNPNEGYSGPVYGLPVAYTYTREVTLTFSAPEGAAPGNGNQFSGSLSFSRESFPQFVEAMSAADWPSQLVNDERCSVPTTIGEDYSGPACTGTIIASVANNNVVTKGTPGADDYSGFERSVPPSRNQATIALSLKLQPASLAAVGSANTSAGK